jgi:signal transduction histidine kinase
LGDSTAPYRLASPWSKGQPQRSLPWRQHAGPLYLARTGEGVQLGELHRNSTRWSNSSKKVLVVLAFLLPALLAGGSLRGQSSYALTAIEDCTQFFLLATATLFFLWRGHSARGTSRAFWFLIAFGFTIWSVSMFLQVYQEVWLRSPVSSMPPGALLHFVTLIPMLAALAIEPDNDGPARPRLLSFFDVASLLICWIYIYLFWATAYLLAGNDLLSYNSHSRIVDAVANQVFLLILALVAFRSQGAWRHFYLHFLGAAATYGFASILINNAIGSRRYYRGSFYDLPLNSAIAWFCLTAITCNVNSQRGQPHPEERRRPNSKIVPWSARLSVLATLSTPVIGLWLVTKAETQESVSHFRILLTLFTMLLLTILLLLKQDLLNFKLARYLQDASLAYSNLKRFEEQLVQNEKLASLGKLVARVAHGINEAMGAVAKDVEELSSSPTADVSCRRMTAKIGESAGRTKSLVENMLRFAQEMPLHRSSVNVRPLLESAVNLTGAERQHHVHVKIDEQGDAPIVEADANQLIQVFLHIITNAIDAMEGNSHGLLTIVIRAEQGHIEIDFMDTGSGLRDPRRVFEPFYTTKPVGRGVGLGLSTCYGIIRQHDGDIDCHNRPEGGAIFRLVLPSTVGATREAGF